MRELASFTGIALAMLRDQQRTQIALKQQEVLTAEMSHRVKNLFSVVASMINVSKRSSTSVADMAEILSGRLHALAAAHALVRPSFNSGTDKPFEGTASLHGLIRAILKPYEAPGANCFVATGEEIILGDRATTGLALVIHELTTNAAKYGALSQDGGCGSISWRSEDEAIALQWREIGGPSIAA
jgi:two-component sensor histidine kinase